MKFTHAIENYKDVFQQVWKNKWVTLQDILWYIDYENKNEFRIIPEGFEFNWGNSPCFTHCIVDDDDYPFAFCGHDFDYSWNSEYIILDLNNLSETFEEYMRYWTISVSNDKVIFIPDRKFADLVLKDTIQVEWLSKFRAKLVYRGVRLWWRRNFIKNESH